MNSTLRLIIDLILKIIGFKNKDKQPAGSGNRPEVSNGSNKPAATTPPPPPPEEEKPLTPVMEISEEMMQTKLMLGHYDEDFSSDKMQETLTFYHRNMPAVPNATKQHKMRQGDLFDWVELKPLPGHAVKTLKSFLKNAGILHPAGTIDGNFDYAAQAGVRLFQEYVRIYEGKDIIPNGIVDGKTWKIMKEWQDNKKTAKKWPRGKKSQEYKDWMSMLQKAKDHYRQSPHIINQKVNEVVQKLNGGNGVIDTFPVDQWTTNEDEIHLIGIRRKEDAAGGQRVNDDVFVLLINGMVFKFWGSTDPKQGEDRRMDEAFLSEGQHKFRFGWHNVSAGRNTKLYQGLNPFDKGVLVFRDDLRTNDNRLTEADIEKGIDGTPNQSINIHWTGIGDANRATWSEGCQVIAGRSYIDNYGNSQDCVSFAARGSGDLQNNNEDNITYTKAAYNMFSDLLLLYQDKNRDYLIYTLGRDETLMADFLAGTRGGELLADAFKDVIKS